MHRHNNYYDNYLCHFLKNKYFYVIQIDYQVQ